MKWSSARQSLRCWRWSSSCASRRRTTTSSASSFSMTRRMKLFRGLRQTYKRRWREAMEVRGHDVASKRGTDGGHIILVVGSDLHRTRSENGWRGSKGRETRGSGGSRRECEGIDVSVRLDPYVSFGLSRIQLTLLSPEFTAISDGARTSLCS